LTLSIAHRHMLRVISGREELEALGSIRATFRSRCNFALVTSLLSGAGRPVDGDNAGEPPLPIASTATRTGPKPAVARS
jgi:hypothetical protein